VFIDEFALFLRQFENDSYARYLYYTFGLLRQLVNGVLAPTKSRIVGRVYGETGVSLGGAKVTCNGKETLTLFDGAYAFEGIAPGAYTVSVNLRGYRSQSKPISIKKSEVATVDFHLVEAIGTAKIYGHVYDDETKPIPTGAAILILPTTNRCASIDEHGYYEFTNLVADTYVICTSIPGYIDQKATVTVAEGETKVQDFHCEIERTVEPPWG